jgi:predicted HTH transcriptional regulator
MLNSKTPNFEELHSSKLITAEDVLELLDYKKVIRLLSKPLPQTQKEVLMILADEKMITYVDNGGYYITNLGALSAANNIRDFENLSRKAIRLIEYKGNTKVETIKEYPGTKGYANGFEGLIDFIIRLLPSNEIIRKALREEKPVYPEIAIRELVANALIHQDFTIRGAGPLIEIFEDRIEITNPGKLLPEKKIDRLIRTAPQSRNEILASKFRELKICEERGSGFEKAISNIEKYGLPPLKMQEIDNSFRVTMYKPKSFAQLTPTERIEACYQHCVICYFSSGGMTNSSLRERFRMHDKQRPQVSLVIKEALILGKIKPRDPENTSSKFIEYIPSWG